MDQHDLISALKQLASELGRTPTRREFGVVKGAEYNIGKLFNGSFAALVQAAGLESAKPRKIDNSIFERSLEKHLDALIPAPALDLGPYPTLASISDIHWPFASKRVVERFLEYVGDEKPERVVIDGDAWDMYSHSKYPRSHNIFTPREEQAKARAMNEEFWAEVKRRSPESICHQMMGNHDIRPLKRVLESYPAAEDWIEKTMKELFSFPGVTTVMDPREELYIRSDIVVFHGYRSQLGAHRDYTLLNTVNGHTHKGGVVFRQIRGRTLWELNCGLAGDPESKGLTYTPQRITTWTPGFGALNRYGPQFISV